jgi:hypothetical protein
VADATPLPKALGFLETQMLYQGHCHCGAVGFEVEAPEELVCQDCNCSVCRMTGFIHLIVSKSAFRLLRGKEILTTYNFNTGVAQHYFCSRCGIKPYYIPRSNPDGYDINVRCLDPQPKSVTIEPFDGQNWEDHAHELHHLSKAT